MAHEGLTIKTIECVPPVTTSEDFERWAADPPITAHMGERSWDYSLGWGGRLSATAASMSAISVELGSGISTVP